MCKRAAQAEPEAERASTKPKLDHQDSASAEHKPENDAASDLDAESLHAWLEDWMKAHVASILEEDLDLNVSTLVEDIRETVASLMEDNFQEFVEDLKSDHNVTMPDSSELQDKLFDAEVDYLHCAALTRFLGNQFRVNFRNKKRFSEFEERVEESGTIDQLQFDVLYDFAMYIANRGSAGSEESEDDEEPVEEEDSDESDSEEESEGSGESGSESDED